MTDPSQQQILLSLFPIPRTFHPAVPLPLAVSLAAVEVTQPCPCGDGL